MTGNEVQAALARWNLSARKAGKLLGVDARTTVARWVKAGDDEVPIDPRNEDLLAFLAAVQPTAEEALSVHASLALDDSLEALYLLLSIRYGRAS
jgi:hypothetical protein